jgi:hypothetical protein
VVPTTTISSWPHTLDQAWNFQCSRCAGLARTATRKRLRFGIRIVVPGNVWAWLAYAPQRKRGNLAQEAPGVTHDQARAADPQSAAAAQSTAAARRAAKTRRAADAQSAAAAGAIPFAVDVSVLTRTNGLSSTTPMSAVLSASAKYRPLERCSSVVISCPGSARAGARVGPGVRK